MVFIGMASEIQEFYRQRNAKIVRLYEEGAGSLKEIAKMMDPPLSPGRVYQIITTRDRNGNKLLRKRYLSQN